MMMMQQAIPMDRPIILMMLCNLSLRNNLKANMKKLVNMVVLFIGLIGSIRFIGLVCVACSVLRGACNA
jgi:hypothetical protein